MLLSWIWSHLSHSHPQPPALVAPKPQPYPASCCVSPGWGRADGRAPLWGPQLWQLAKGLRGSAGLSQQPLSDAQPSPNLQKLWRRQYAHAQTHTHTLMDSEYQVGPWEPLTSQSAKPQQLERLKPPHVSERKSSRGVERGRNGWNGRKKKGNKYIFMFSVMSASPSTPPADVIGKIRKAKSEEGWK